MARSPSQTTFNVTVFTNSDLTRQRSIRWAAPPLSDKKLQRLLKTAKEMGTEDQRKLLDMVDQAHPTADPRNVKLLSVLGEVCSAIRQLPTSASLSTGLKKRGSMAVGSGGLADIWVGERGCKQVAIKTFRITGPDDVREAKKILWKRVPTWRKLSHENILPFHGVEMSLFPLGLVYDWGQHGNISQYVAKYPEASRPSLLFDVTKGLNYLHSLDIPHGDLKGTNIVIDQYGHARLAEYGLAPVHSHPGFTVAATAYAVREVSRWLAPEIIKSSRNGDGVPVTESKPGDVYSFAMVAVEVFTGKKPFEEQKNGTVVQRILRGARPEKPKGAREFGLTCEMWKLLETCWQEDPSRRPAMEEVVRIWRKFVGGNDDNSITAERPLSRPAGEPSPGTSRPWTKSKATQPRAMSEATPSRSTGSETAQSRIRPAAPRSTPRRRMSWFYEMSRFLSDTWGRLS